MRNDNNWTVWWYCYCWNDRPPPSSSSLSSLSFPCRTLFKLFIWAWIHFVLFVCLSIALPRNTWKASFRIHFRWSFVIHFAFYLSPSLCVCACYFCPIFLNKMQHFFKSFSKAFCNWYLECRPGSRIQVRLVSFLIVELSRNNMKSSEATHEGRITRSPTVKHSGKLSK